MKKISGRAIVTTLLSLLVVVGMAAFIVQYFLDARQWVTTQGSPHVYSGGNISNGSIRDRDGVLVLDNGRVSGFDTPANLLKTNAIYQDVYNSQTNGSGDFDEKGGEA